MEVWNKTRETGAEEVASVIRKFRRKYEEKDGVTLEEEEEGERKNDIDSPVLFIKTLLYGTRFLCKYLDMHEVAYGYAKRAKEIFEADLKGKSGEKGAEGGGEAEGEAEKKLESEIERCLGVSLGGRVEQSQSFQIQSFSSHFRLLPCSYLPTLSSVNVTSRRRPSNPSFKPFPLLNPS